MPEKVRIVVIRDDYRPLLQELKKARQVRIKAEKTELQALKKVLRTLSRNPSYSLRDMASLLGLSHERVRQMLKDLRPKRQPARSGRPSSVTR